MNKEDLTKIEKKQLKIIGEYLAKRCEKDKVLLEKIENSKKTLVGCFAFIKSEAKKQAEDNCAMIEDSQVFEWATHYFLEDSLDFEPKKVETKKTDTKKAKDNDLFSEDTETEEKETDNDLFEEEKPIVKETTKKGKKPQFAFDLFGEEL